MMLSGAAGACRASKTKVAPSPDTAVSVTTVEIVPGPDQAFVTGTLASLSADNATAPPLRPPFTITTPARGQGNGSITGVQVGGRDFAISWYEGQPLPVSGTGQLDLAGAPVAVTAAGITWTLDGAPRALTAGHFSLGAPVAAGSSGLATPYDGGIAFDAGVRATLTTTGMASVHLAPAAIHLEGPGRHVTLQGQFQVRTAAGTRQAQSITFGPGSYSIDLAPASGGYSIRGTLQGPTSAA
ncbi:MAG: hypothetical protein M3N98_01575 [Actinomycetota bacterium]|nr:hypothetical protein [Actinomycetota bacterium]